MNLANIAEKAVAALSEPLSLEVLKSSTGQLTPMEQSAAKDLYTMRYPMISLEFLRMRDEHGWPKFAIFSPKSPTCMLAGLMDRGRMFSDNWLGDGVNRLSKRLIHAYFEDVIERLENLGYRGILRSSVIFRISQTFNGTIPRALRDEMRSAAEIIPGETFVIAEAGGWKVEKTIVPFLSKLDPLIIRFPDYDVGKALLLGHFEATKAEEYIAREFVT